MPTYDYACEGCGHRFEVFHSIVAAPIRKCPRCKKLKVKRMIGTGAGIIFRGSGFYQTDYRSDSYKKSAESDKAPSAPAKSESSTLAAAPASAEASTGTKKAS